MLMDYVNTNSRPGDLKIADIRAVDIARTPMHYTLMKVYTNQGLVGYGEVRDDRPHNYVLALRSRLIGRNPCNIDKLFHRIEQLGSSAGQGGGVCGIELTPWDLAGETYGVSAYQILGDKFRNRIRMYCDTDIERKHTSKEVRETLKKRMKKGFIFLKAGLGIDLLYDIPGASCTPLGTVGDLNQSPRIYEAVNYRLTPERRSLRNRMYDMQNTPHPFTGVQVTEYDYDILEQCIEDVRSVIGHEIPPATGHFGHVDAESCIRLARKIEKYNIVWVENLIPQQLTDQYVRLRGPTTVPICAGENIYLKEDFRPLMERGGVSIIHPDTLISGDILKNKKVEDMAQEYGMAMAVHMAGSLIACMTAVHSIVTTKSFLALEFHSVDIPWWSDLVIGLPNPIIDNGYITAPDASRLGIESLEDEVIREHLHPDCPDMQVDISDWDNDYSHDRTWS